MGFRPARAATVVAAIALAVALLPTATARAGAPARPKAKFTGPPLTVMTIGEFQVASVGSANPELAGAVKARAKAINANGGIKDASGATHQVKVIACNTNLDPNRATQCAQDAADRGVVAVVGDNSVNGGEILPVLENAGIASAKPAHAATPAARPAHASARVPASWSGEDRTSAIRIGSGSAQSERQ